MVMLTHPSIRRAKPWVLQVARVRPFTLRVSMDWMTRIGHTSVALKRMSRLALKSTVHDDRQRHRACSKSARPAEGF
jgi:hypothetical protein